MKSLFKKIIFILIFLSVFIVNKGFTQKNDWALARQSYYAALSSQDSLESALKRFKKLSNADSMQQPLSLAYIGSLTALRGKYALLPWSKLKWVKKGLQMLDRAVDLETDDIEIRFIRGTTCFYLPSFFKRKRQAVNDFKTILALLPSGAAQKDKVLVKNALQFIEQNIELTEAEQEKIKRLKLEFVRNEF